MESTQFDITGKDRIVVEKDGEEIDVFNHASVAEYHYVNSVNGYESFEADLAKGDLGNGPEPDAVTERLATLLYDEFGIDVEDRGIEVIDPTAEGVHVL